MSRAWILGGPSRVRSPQCPFHMSEKSRKPARVLTFHSVRKPAATEQNAAERVLPAALSSTACFVSQLIPPKAQINQWQAANPDLQIQATLVVVESFSSWLSFSSAVCTTRLSGGCGSAQRYGTEQRTWLRRFARGTHCQRSSLPDKPWRRPVGLGLAFHGPPDQEATLSYSLLVSAVSRASCRRSAYVTTAPRLISALARLLGHTKDLCKRNSPSTRGHSRKRTPHDTAVSKDHPR